MNARLTIAGCCYHRGKAAQAQHLGESESVSSERRAGCKAWRLLWGLARFGVG